MLNKHWVINFYTIHVLQKYCAFRFFNCVFMFKTYLITYCIGLDFTITFSFGELKCKNWPSGWIWLKSLIPPKTAILAHCGGLNPYGQPDHKISEFFFYASPKMILKSFLIPFCIIRNPFSKHIIDGLKKTRQLSLCIVNSYFCIRRNFNSWISTLASVFLL